LGDVKFLVASSRSGPPTKLTNTRLPTATDFAGHARTLRDRAPSLVMKDVPLHLRTPPAPQRARVCLREVPGPIADDRLLGAGLIAVVLEDKSVLKGRPLGTRLLRSVTPEAVGLRSVVRARRMLSEFKGQSRFHPSHVVRGSGGASRLSSAPAMLTRGCTASRTRHLANRPTCQSSLHLNSTPC